MIMKRPVQCASPAAVVVGSKGWRDATVRSILRAEDLLRQTHADQLHSSARYRSHSVGTFTSRFPQLTAYSVNSSVDKERNESDSEKQKEFRPKSIGSMLTSGIISGPFPLPVLRDQSAVVSTECKIMDYTIFFVKLWDGADDLLHSERRGLNVLKQELESMLKKILTQQQVLAESSKQLLDCAFERSIVTELLPQHGSLSAGVKTYPSPLSLKPDPTGPFTPECKQALDSSSTVLRQSQQLRENISQVMSDVIRKQTDMHHSASEALLKKITETINLEQHLTLSSAATRQAIYRKQRQMQCAGYSLGRAMGPVCSADLFCRERLSRPMTQLYGRHSSSGLPESDLLTQGSTMLRKHLESSGKEIAKLQVTHQQLEDDKYGKRAAASVDSAVIRLRGRLVRPQSVRPATS
ncbi:hypothetical protein cypCar_00010078 [Cyprinus carpio]|nr:hypothetical protein cypCar_00010078 [Cyprinus carpio]